MLQMRQLENVSERYPSEIDTLRAFLRSAEPRPYAYGSLAAVASQVRQAGRFHRDLGSHLMVLKHLGISPPDLLGIVALAAGELNGAATARESDAHEVLRFILTGATATSGESAPRKSAFLQFYSRWSWPDSLVCVVVALLLGVMYVRHEANAASQRRQAAMALPPTASQPLSSQDLPPESVAVLSAERSAGAATMYKAPSQNATIADPTFPRRRSYPPAAASKTLQPAQPLLAARTSPVSPMEHGALIVRVPANSIPPAADRRMLGSSVTRGGLPVATPTAVLSQRLGARTLPANDPAIDQTSGQPYPRLLRRSSASAVTPETASNANLIAVNVSPSRLRTYAAQAASAGSVRPVSLGTMAANIVYSPAPVYPVAAATARVQGQVTIQAEVDRDGSVASARVVSGPPLLRDAALDAVMRWRYRPRTVSGRPVTAAATALVEFELP